jgi:hypothetical protein
VRGPKLGLGSACIACAAASFGLFTVPGGPDSFSRTALLLTNFGAFILAPVTLLWWLGNRTDRAERARERSKAAAAWRAALAEASTSATSRQPRASAPLEGSVAIRLLNAVQDRGRGENQAIARYNSIVPSQVAAAPSDRRHRLEQAIEIELARLSADKQREMKCANTI